MKKIALLAGILIVVAWLWWRHSPSTQKSMVDASPSGAYDIEAPKLLAKDRLAPGVPADVPVGPERKPAPPVSDRSDLRFEVRWGQTGLCGPQDVQTLKTRTSLLASFESLEHASSPVFHDPSVEPFALGVVQRFLGYAADKPRPQGLAVTAPPTIYVYKDVEQMLSASCVNRSAIGYYDGAIHVAADLRYRVTHIEETLIHEYNHHVLMSAGVRVPMWLQEGLAMLAAKERWWLDPSLGLMAWILVQHLPFDAMVGAFPHVADEKFATAAYYQCLVMVEFVRDQKGEERLGALVQMLAHRQVSAADAFSWATGLDGDSLERAWKDFVMRRDRELEDLKELVGAAGSAP